MLKGYVVEEDAHSLVTTLVSVLYFVGDDSYETVRSRGYAGADVILMCFSMDFPNTLINIIDRWMPEVMKYCPNGMATSHLLILLKLLLLL